jgi:FXSXX-COOH protein
MKKRFPYHHRLLTIGIIDQMMSIIVHGSLCTVLAVLVRPPTLRVHKTASRLAKLPKGWSERQNLCGVRGGRLVPALKVTGEICPSISGSSGDTMTSQDQDHGSILPDLRDLPLDRLAELGDSVLAHSLALYRQRLKESGEPLNSFSATI